MAAVNSTTNATSSEAAAPETTVSAEPVATTESSSGLTTYQKMTQAFEEANAVRQKNYGLNETEASEGSITEVAAAPAGDSASSTAQAMFDDL